MKSTGFHHIPRIESSHPPACWILGCFLSLSDKVRASYQIGFILTLNGGSLTTWTILLPLQICCRRRRRHSSYTFDLTGRYCSSIALLPLAQSSGFHVATGYLPRSANQMAERAPPHHLHHQQFAMGGGAVLAVGSQCCRDNKLVIVPVYLK